MADWDINNPADDGIVSQYPANARARREAVMDIFDADHISEDGVDQGKHRASRYRILASDPTAVAGQSTVYAKDVSGVAELFWVDSAGTIRQLTSGGKLRTQLLQDLVDTAALQDGALANSAAGRLKMEAGFFQNLTTALNKFETGFWSASSLARSKFADGFVTAQMLQDTYAVEQTTTAAANGDFNSGTFRFTRIGRLVTITATGIIASSSSMSAPSTNNNFIPSAYRPGGSGLVENLYNMGAGKVERLFISATSHTISLQARDWSGSAFSQTNWGRPSVSYTVA